MDNNNTVYLQPNVMPETLRRDPVRKVSKLRVGVKFREGANAKVLAEVRWVPANANDQGWVEGVIYEDQLPRLEEEVFTDSDAAKRAQAEELFVYKQREFVAEREGFTIDRIPEDPSEWTKRQKRLAKLYPGSLEAELAGLTKRGSSKPFAAVTVIENLGVPKTDQEEMLTRFAQATGVGGGQSEAMTQVLSAVTQALDGIVRRLEALEKPRKSQQPAP